MWDLANKNKKSYHIRNIEVTSTDKGKSCPCRNESNSIISRVLLNSEEIIKCYVPDSFEKITKVIISHYVKFVPIDPIPNEYYPVKMPMEIVLKPKKNRFNRTTEIIVELQNEE